MPRKTRNDATKGPDDASRTGPSTFTESIRTPLRSAEAVASARVPLTEQDECFILCDFPARLAPGPPHPKVSSTLAAIRAEHPEYKISEDILLRIEMLKQQRLRSPRSW
jgi:hypothetical protein